MIDRPLFTTMLRSSLGRGEYAKVLFVTLVVCLKYASLNTGRTSPAIFIPRSKHRPFSADKVELRWSWRDWKDLQHIPRQETREMGCCISKDMTIDDKPEDENEEKTTDFIMEEDELIQQQHLGKCTLSILFQYLLDSVNLL